MLTFRHHFGKKKSDLGVLYYLFLIGEIKQKTTEERVMTDREHYVRGVISFWQGNWRGDAGCFALDDKLESSGEDQIGKRLFTAWRAL